MPLQGKTSTHAVQAIFGSLLAGLVPLFNLIFNRNLALLERDHILIWLPSKKLLLDGIHKEGFIPLWNHFSEGGMPFWADLNNSVLFPLNLILLPFSNPADGMTAYVFSLLTLSYFGFWFLLRTLRVPQSLALLLAFSLPWSGVALSSVNLIHILAGQAAVPYFFSFLIRWVRGGQFADAVITSFFLALPTLGGDPQFSYILSFFLVGFGVRRSLCRKSINPLLASFGIGVLSFACGAAQILPTIDLALQRSGGLRVLGQNEALLWSSPPWRLLEMMFPHFFGSTVPKSEGFWGGAIMDNPLGSPFFNSLYLGIWVIPSAFLLVLHPPRSRVLTAKTLSLCALIIIGFLISFGRKGPFPLYENLAHFLPGWDLFRYPERLIFWPQFGILLLISMHSKRLFFLLRKPRGLELLTVATLVMSLHVISILIWKEHTLWDQLLHTFFNIVFFMVIINLLLRRHLKAAFWIALLILATDCYVHSQSVFHLVRRDLLVRENVPMVNNLLGRLAAIKDDGSARRVHNLHPYKNLVSDKLRETLSEEEIRNHLTLMGIEGNTSILYGIQKVTSYNSITPTHKLRVWHSLSESDPKKLFDLMSVRFLFSLNLMDSKRPGQYFLVDNPRALPELYFPKSITVLPPEKDPILELPRLQHHEIALISAPETWPVSSEGEWKVTGFERTGRGIRATFNSGPQKVGPKVLVWNSTYDRNWTVRINGKRTAAALANAWALAAPLPAHPENSIINVEIQYESPWIWAGVVISSLWLLLATVTVWRCRKSAPEAPN